VVRHEHQSISGVQPLPLFLTSTVESTNSIGEVRERLNARDTLMLMSDHGFCSIKAEVFYNNWLAEAGFLKYSSTPVRTLDQLAPGRCGV